MEIKVGVHSFEIENSGSSVQSVFELINNVLDNDRLVLRSMNIDSIEVNQGFNEYIGDNINTIQKIEVITKTIEEDANDVIVVAKDCLKNTGNLARKLGKSFYQGATGNTWNETPGLFDCIQDIFDIFQLLRERSETYVKDIGVWEGLADNERSLRISIEKIALCFEKKDSVSIADILIYEVKPICDEILKYLDRLNWKE